MERFLSIFLIVGAVVSGLGSLWGIAFGALLIEFLYSGDIEHWLGVPKSVPPDVFFPGYAATIDDTSWFEPRVEIWTRSAPPWAPHFENAARYERLPD